MFTVPFRDDLFPPGSSSADRLSSRKLLSEPNGARCLSRGIVQRRVSRHEPSRMLTLPFRDVLFPPGSSSANGLYHWQLLSQRWSVFSRALPCRQLLPFVKNDHADALQPGCFLSSHQHDVNSALYFRKLLPDNRLVVACVVSRRHLLSINRRVRLHSLRRWILFAQPWRHVTQLLPSLPRRELLPRWLPSQHAVPTRYIQRRFQRHPGIRVLAVSCRLVCIVWCISLFAVWE